jgi:hypothetical protein
MSLPLRILLFAAQGSAAAGNRRSIDGEELGIATLRCDEPAKLSEWLNSPLDDVELAAIVIDGSFRRSL